MKNKGFTLVELIIVVAVIAVLASVLAPQYLRYVERSRQSNDLQVATNIMRAATVALADPQSNVRPGQYLEIMWATGDSRADAQDLYSGLLYIRTPQAVRVSEMSGTLDPITDVESLVHLQEMILGIMGVSPDDIITDPSSREGVIGNIGDAESVAGGEASFAFHISTSTGEIALAKYSADGDVNVWIDEMGVDAIPAP